MQVKFNIAIALVNVFILFSTSNAQPGKQPIQLGLQIHRGFLLNHSPARTNKSDADLKSIYGFEINALWQTLGSKPWHRYYGFPKWGASFIYYSVGSGTTYVQYDKGDKTLYNVNWGDCYTLLIHSSLKPISTRFFEMNIRLGTGFGYFTSIYNANDNPGNLWISSRINPAMGVGSWWYIYAFFKRSHQNAKLGRKLPYCQRGAAIYPISRSHKNKERFNI
jgi:hypothetical protein